MVWRNDKETMSFTSFSFSLVIIIIHVSRVTHVFFSPLASSLALARRSDLRLRSRRNDSRRDFFSDFRLDIWVSDVPVKSVRKANFRFVYLTSTNVDIYQQSTLSSYSKQLSNQGFIESELKKSI